MIGSWFDDPGRRPAAAPAPAAAPSGAAGPAADWRRVTRRRVATVLALLGVWVVVIQGRLVHVQVIEHGWYAERAQQLQEYRVVIPGTRGDIVDRRGELLAYSVDAVSLGADPSLIDDPALAVDQLCEALADCTARERRALLDRFARSDRRWVPVRQARQVSPDQEARLRALDLRWVALSDESRRYYPGRALAAHVLGFVGAENTGLGGVESRFDDLVVGEPGVANIRRDADQRRLFAEVLKPAETGATLELTIDRRLQYEAEVALREQVSETRAVGGTAIVLQPRTGEILALANYPTFNPNDYQASSEDDRRNRAVQDVYEPGSTFKIITAAAALEDRIYTPQSMFAVQGPGLSVAGRSRLITDDHPSAVPLSLEDVVVKSSNVGAALVGLRLGAERLTRYASRFGLGQRLAPDFAGESPGILHPPQDLRIADLATVAMGYTVSVTPLQMAVVAGAIANGGQVMEPHVIGAVVTDGVREPVEPKVLRQAISPETAATMSSFLAGVVDRGTARAAKMARYDAAGKTGTAKKAIAGGYSETDRVSSFVGFVPARRPEFVILVMIDTPRNGQVYGGAVAAPAFKRIAESALRLYGVTPTVDPDPPYVAVASAAPEVEPVSALRLAPAARPLGGQALLPDVRGMSARDAIEALHEFGVDVRIAGDGSVVAQTPPPGEPVAPGGWIALQLSREAAGAASRAGGGGR